MFDDLKNLKIEEITLADLLVLLGFLLDRDKSRLELFSDDVLEALVELTEAELINRKQIKVVH